MAKKNFIVHRYRSWRKTWNQNLDSPLKRFFAHLDAVFIDHSFFRIWFQNFHQVAEGVYRSNQPSPRQIRKLHRMGIRTIVNLRGASEFGSYALERETCKELGIKLIDLRMYSRRMPSVESVLEAQKVFANLEKPVLLHCKAGSDRAGLGSALYSLLIDGQPIEVAQKQLSFKYLHIKAAKTGRLDHFFESYRRFNVQTPTPFLDWLQNHYDQEHELQTFHANGLANTLIDRILNRE
ncbi:tyrosine-protein phosphatase [Gynuella sp.]|uniref:tyrosine-protein phosphatase n=1 Tax=Gynuella sp. TaxID=2969146 RepID=UPI003D108F6E